MKYLKKFESRINLASEEQIREICKDVLVELLEEDFNINIDARNTLARPIFEVSVNRYIHSNNFYGVRNHTPKTFNWKEVSDKFIFLAELLRSEFKILKSMGSEIEIRDDKDYFYNFTIDELIEETESGNYKEHNGRRLDTLLLTKITILNVT